MPFYGNIYVRYSKTITDPTKINGYSIGSAHQEELRWNGGLSLSCLSMTRWNFIL